MPKLPRLRLSEQTDLLVAHPRLWPVLVLILSLALVVGFGTQMTRYTERQEQQATRLQGLQLGAQIQQRVRAYEVLLRATGNAFAFVPDINADFFSSFVKGLQLGTRYGGLTGVGWLVPVPRADIPALEASRRAEGAEDFFVWPVTNDRINYTVLYLLPENARNRGALGYNMYSDPERRQAMLEAFSKGVPTVTGPVQLRQSTAASQNGFLIYAPVFSGLGRTAGEAPARNAFRGFVYGAFNTEQLFNDVMNQEQRERLDIELYDVSLGGPRLLHDTHPEVWSLQRKGSISIPLQLSGRSWQLIVSSLNPSQSVDRSQRFLVNALIGVGILLSFLLTLLTMVTVRSAVAARQSLQRQIKQVEIRTILLRELNHRVKNTLATVNSLVALSRHNAQDVDSYCEALNGRLRALSATHDLLTQSEWGDTELKAIAEAELAPYRGQVSKVKIEGPSVYFEPTKALSIGLSFHELATNAAKYGALSTSEGQVSLTWKVSEDGYLHVLWEESGGPSVAPKRKAGFGSTLIEKLMARQLRAQVELRFPDTGAVCEFRIPMTNLTTPTRNFGRTPMRS